MADTYTKILSSLCFQHQESSSPDHRTRKALDLPAWESRAIARRSCCHRRNGESRTHPSRSSIRSDDLKSHPRSESQFFTKSQQEASRLCVAGWIRGDKCQPVADRDRAKVHRHAGSASREVDVSRANISEFWRGPECSARRSTRRIETTRQTVAPLCGSRIGPTPTGAAAPPKTHPAALRLGLTGQHPSR